MRHVPDESLSRVSAYDWFGSIAFQPLGMAIWGPIAALIGIVAGAVGRVRGCRGATAALLATPAIRALPRRFAGSVRPVAACEQVCAFRPAGMRTCVRALRRAPRPHRLLLPGRRFLARRAGGRGGRAGASGDGGGRPQRRLGLDGVRAWRPSRSGCGRSTGWRWIWRRLRGRAGTSRCWSRTPWAGATCAGSSRAHTCTTATKHEPPPAVPLETLEEHAAGLVLPERVRGSRRARRADAAAAAGRLRARSPAGRAAAPVPAPRPLAQPRARPAGAAARACPRWRPATSTRTRARARRCRTRSWRCAIT